MYKVIKCFTDLTDGHKYDIGDIFPREGVEVSDARIAKLASDANRQKTPVIKEVEHSTETSSPALQKTVGREVQNKAEPVEDKPKAKRTYNRKKK